MKGIDKDHAIDVTFENLTVAGKKCTNPAEAFISKNDFVNINFK